jgi:flagellar biosynthesis protein FliR
VIQRVLIGVSIGFAVRIVFTMVEFASDHRPADGFNPAAF